MEILWSEVANDLPGDAASGILMFCWLLSSEAFLDFFLTI